MKKIISILACVCLLLSVMIVPVSAADGVTISFADGTNRTSYSTEQQVWEQNGITVTNNKSLSTSNVRDNVNDGHIRCYKGSEVIVEYPGMTALVIDHTGLDSKYVSWATSFTDSNATAVATANTTTITFATPVDSFTFTSMATQCRAFSMTVYTGEVCSHNDCTYTSNGDETHTVVCNNCSETISTADCQDINLDGVCDTCEGDVALPETLTIAEAIELGAAQGTSAYTTDKYYVTGVITAVANTTYGNMYIADEEGNEIYIYGMYNADGSVRYDALDAKPDEGDTVTVLSVVGNYNGTVQLKNVWLIEFTAGELEPTTPDPEADTALTIEEAITLGESKKSNVYTENKYYVTGTITEVYNETYGNMYIADENGNSLTVYGTYSEDGSTGYADMETKPVAGDTITVYGIIGNYNGTAQMKNGWITSISTGEEEVPGIDPEAPIKLAVNTTTPATLTEVVVPAGATVFMQAADATGTLYVTSSTGSYMLINGMQNQVTADAETELVLCGYEMVNVYNPSETDEITLYVFLEAGEGVAVGTWENPEELVLAGTMWNPNALAAQANTELEAENQGYFYKVVAPNDGAISINVSAYDSETYDALGYRFSATNNNTSYQSEIIAEAAGSDNYYDAIAIIPVKAGDEVIINAGTYDADNTWAAPAGAINVNVSFDANGSQNLPIIIEDTGDQKTTVDAESQGIYYKWVATAEGTVTVTMNDEAGWQYSVGKVPVDESDYSNYYNSDTHWYSDDPVVATETIDVVAGETIKVWVNTFDPANESVAPAGTVNWTLGFAEKLEGPNFSIADVDAVAGKEFTVAIDITNNPGIIGAKLNINYDINVLELVSAEAGDFTNGSVNVGDEVVPNYNFSENLTDCPYVINWTDPLATENITTNGTFAILTFKVKNSAAAGTTEISITFDEEDIIDVELNNVAFDVVNSIVTITVGDTISGDINGDGKVNGRDYAILLQYLNGWDVEIDETAADVNGDGKLNGRDYAILLQYLNGWDVELV